MTAEPTRRLFFALWPEERMQAALADAARPIAEECDGRAIPAANFHLTLAFLGSVPETQIPALSPIAAGVAAGFAHRAEPIAITLDKVEHWCKSELLCATATAPAATAAALAQLLKDALIAGGFAPDLKPFRVHATLVRKVQRVSAKLTLSPVVWTFADFRLIESRTDPRGSSYSTLEKWALYKRES